MILPNLALPNTTHVKISLVVSGLGRIVDLQIAELSGAARLDSAAVRAIKLSEPIPVLFFVAREECPAKTHSGAVSIQTGSRRQSGSRRNLSPSSHATWHAGPHQAVPKSYRAIAG